MDDEFIGGRSEKRREAILEAARVAFLNNGYLGTSMDEIAALARASKQTVYKHFSDKERLFSEIVIGIVNEIADPNTQDVRKLRDSRDVEADLRDFARRQLRRVMDPRVLQLRRLVIGEAARFPALGHLFHERGPGRTIEALTMVFEELDARGELDTPDPEMAAAHFNWLVMSTPLNHAMLLGTDEPFTPAELDIYANAGVTAFLAAYGRR